MQPSGAGVLVLMVKSWPANTNLARQVATAGLPLDCNSPPEKELVPWLIHHASNQDAVLDADAARLLVELVGAEVGLLTAEVEKLAVYVGEARRIRRADVSRMVEAGRIETVWKVLDAATTGHAAEAIGDLDQLAGLRRIPRQGSGRLDHLAAQDPPRRPAARLPDEPRRGLPDRRHPRLRHREDPAPARSPWPIPRRPASRRAPESGPGSQGGNPTGPPRGARGTADLAGPAAHGLMDAQFWSVPSRIIASRGPRCILRCLRPSGK